MWSTSRKIDSLNDDAAHVNDDDPQTPADECVRVQSRTQTHKLTPSVLPSSAKLEICASNNEPQVGVGCCFWVFRIAVSVVAAVAAAVSSHTRRVCDVRCVNVSNTAPF